MKISSTLFLTCLIIVAMLPLKTTEAREQPVEMEKFEMEKFEMEKTAPSMDIPDEVKHVPIKCLGAIDVYTKAKERVDDLIENRKACAADDIHQRYTNKLRDLKNAITDSYQKMKTDLEAIAENKAKQCKNVLPHRKCGCWKTQRKLRGRVFGLLIGVRDVSMIELDEQLAVVESERNNQESRCRRYRQKLDLDSYIYKLCNARAQACSKCTIDQLADRLGADFCPALISDIKPVEVEIE